MTTISDELITAALIGETSEVQELLTIGADPYAIGENGWSALPLAAAQGHIDVVKILLDKGVNPDTKNGLGNTALNESAGAGFADIVHLLLERGAKTNIKNLFGETVMPTVVSTVWQNKIVGSYLDVLQVLLEHGEDPNQRDQFGNPVLSGAAFSGLTDAVELLLKHGADINLRGKQGWNALDNAAIQGHSATVKVLLDHGADPNFKSNKDNWASSLERAIEMERYDVVELIKNHSQRQLPIISRSDSTVVDANLEEVLQKLQKLIGLDNIKTDVTQLVNFLRVQQMRKEKGLAVPEQSLHMVFTGNPGTGKTTIARLIAQIYKSLGILSKGQFVETDRSGLVAAYLGQTALKVQEVVKSALGGVLFIDEAYSLTNNGQGQDQYGQEAVNTLLKLMEDHRDNLIVIVAGYTEPMQKFIRSNPGLQSRFNKFLHFDDYSPAELTEIFRHFAAQGDYKLSAATELKLGNVFSRLHETRDETFGNARLARNLFEKAINHHANRMVTGAAMDEESLVTLYPEDIPNA